MNLYDIAYSLGLTASAPFWLLRRRSRQKVLGALRTRMGDVASRSGDAPAILIHAVSVGEINATQSLIQHLRKSRPDLRYIVSTTTQTGYERGEALYGSAEDVMLIRYPLDFTAAITRVLDQLRPSLVVLMELELWPNFMLQCSRRGIPVVLANGRITEPSFRKYRRILPVSARMFRRLTMLCAQDETYAGRFVHLGATKDRVVVAGTMKFDTATIADRIDGDEQLASDVGLKLPLPVLGERVGERGPSALKTPESLFNGNDARPSPQPSPRVQGEGEKPGTYTRKCVGLIFLAGSTGPGEESIALDVYQSLKLKYPALRLVIVPRHPPRFDEVAELIRARGLPLVRRSQPAPNPPADAVVLGDTMGELRKFYSLADVVFVGRSLVDLGHRQHGSDMIEPAALGKPVTVGPFTTNFADAMLKFRAAGAIIEVSSGDELRNGVDELLSDDSIRESLGRKARQVVREQQGSTQRHAEIILAVLAKITS